MTITIRQEERDATFTPQCDLPDFGLKKDVPVPCMVLGLFQCVDRDGSGPYFIVELKDGRVTYAEPSRIRLAPVTDRARFLGVPNA